MSNMKKIIFLLVFSVVNISSFAFRCISTTPAERIEKSNAKGDADITELDITELKTKAESDLLACAYFITGTIGYSFSHPKTESLKDIAVEYARTGRYDQAMQVAQTIKEDYQRAGILGGIAAEYAKAGQYDQALQVTTTIASDYAKSEALTKIAGAYRESGQVDKALPLLSQALKITETGNLPIEDIAAEYARAGQYDKALLMADAMKSAGAKSFVLANIADTYLESGQKDKASQLLSQAVEIGRINFAYLCVLKHIAIAYAKMGQYEQGLSLVKTMGNIPCKTEAFQGMAVEYAKTGQYDRAFQVAEEIKDPSPQAVALAQIADVYAQAKQKTEASRVLSRALMIAEAIPKNPPLISLPFAMDPEMGRYFYDQTAVVFKEKAAAPLKEIAVEYAKIGEYEQALKLAKAITDVYYKVGALLGINRCYEQSGEKIDANSRKILQEITEETAERSVLAKDSRAAGLLIKALTGEDLSVRSEAASGLLEIKDPGLLEPFIPVLVENLGNTATTRPMVAISNDVIMTFRVCDEAVTLLRKIGEPAIAAVTDVLKTPNDLVRKNALEVLTDHPDNPRTAAALVTLLKNKDASLRWKAERLLNQIKEPDLIAPLTAALKDKDVALRWAVVSLLRGMSVSAGTEELLCLALNDENASVRKKALRALRETGSRDRRLLEPLIAELKDKDPAVRQYAKDSLSNINNFNVNDIGPITTLLEDKDVSLRLLTVSLLLRIKDPTAIKSLVAAYHDNDNSVRQGVIKCLWPYRSDPQVVELLITALKDKDSSIQSEAGDYLWSLSQIKPLDPRVVEQLMAASRDQDPYVRKTAIKSLEYMDDPRITEFLLAAALRDEDAAVRKTAGEALVHRKKDSSRVIEALIAVLENKNEDFSVRQSAAELLGYIKSYRAVTPLIDALDDSKDWRLGSAAMGALRYIFFQEWDKEGLNKLYSPRQWREWWEKKQKNLP